MPVTHMLFDGCQQVLHTMVLHSLRGVPNHLGLVEFDALHGPHFLKHFPNAERILTVPRRFSDASTAMTFLQ